jgi:hypothetical protein
MENTFKEVEKKLLEDQGEIQVPTDDAAGRVQIERVEKGYFKKGVSGNPSGKPKGANTKRTERLKMLMDSSLADRWKRYLRELDSLTGIDFVQEYRALMEFRLPKPQRIDGTQVNVNLDKEQAAEYFEIGGKKFLLR